MDGKMDERIDKRVVGWIWVSWWLGGLIIIIIIIIIK